MMVGNDVKWLQQKLGFVGKDLDGKFGTDTRDAVIKFQHDHELDEDGVVGFKQTIPALNKL